MSIGTDRSLSEELVTWLPLMEALVLPYFLWFGSRRYKHAISYIFKVHILRRNHDNEESELPLLSYTIDVSYSFFTDRKSSCRFALLKILNLKVICRYMYQCFTPRVQIHFQFHPRPITQHV